MKILSLSRLLMLTLGMSIVSIHAVDESDIAQEIQQENSSSVVYPWETEHYKLIEQQIKNLSDDASCRSCVESIHAHSYEVNFMMALILFNKMRKAINAFCEEWKLSASVARYLLTFNWKQWGKKREHIQDSPSRGYKAVIPNILGKSEEIKARFESSEFAELLGIYTSLMKEHEIAVNFSLHGECNCRLEDFNMSEETGILRGNFLINLPIDFFDYSADQQRRLLGHECGHIMYDHNYLDFSIALKYLVEKIITGHHNVEMPDIETWVSQADKFENYQQVRDILEQEKGDIPYLENMILRSKSFLRMSRVAEYQADSFFAFIGSDFASCYERALYESADQRPDEVEKEPGTHPSWKKRIDWMMKIRNLLEAEELLAQ